MKWFRSVGGRPAWWVAVAMAILVEIGGRSARADEPVVDLALVLAVDVSRSVGDQEFRLQRQGYAAALVNEKVLAAIRGGRRQAIAVTYVEWSSQEHQKVVVDWRIIRDGENAVLFVEELANAPRSFASGTSISAGIDFAMQRLTVSGVVADRRTIDVSGDGTNNSGRPVQDARDDAVARGVTINGLAIMNQNSLPGAMSHIQPPEGLPAYYGRNVIGGRGAFLVVVRDFESFADAITRKIVTEIADATAGTSDEANP